MSDNHYADIFKTKEEDVKYFADVVRSARKDPALEKAGALSGFDYVMEGKPEQGIGAQYVAQESGQIKIQHGWMHEDYVWHISVKGENRKRTWKVSSDRVIYAIAKTMNIVIPPSLRIEIFPPAMDWDIKEYSVKAFGLRAAWNVPPASIKDLTMRLFDVLNTLV